jgi:hypothetical protein
MIVNSVKVHVGEKRTKGVSAVFDSEFIEEGKAVYKVVKRS